jgi:Flp pilus assembly protein TadG
MVALCTFLLFGLLGMAFDIGRMFIAKNEAMAYVDAAAVAAARQLDGTPQGGARATAAALEGWARWNFGTTTFASPVVEFSVSKDGPWDAAPASWTNVGHARVTATVTNIPLFFIPLASFAGDIPNSGQVAYLAVAGQIRATPQNVFPFSPIAHADLQTSAEVTGADIDFGFIKGGRYTFRWPQNPSLGSGLCPEDNNALWLNKVDQSNGGWRGYITSHDASTIRGEIQNDIIGRAEVPVLDQSATINGGNGNKGTEASAMEDRVNQDADHFSTEYYTDAEITAFYNAAPAGAVTSAFLTGRAGADPNAYNWRRDNPNGLTYVGNGRRVVTVLVNSGARSSTANPGTFYASPNTVLGYAQFFLYELTYKAKPQDTYCAEYIGNNPCTGCAGGTAVPGDGKSEIIIRLEQ